MRSIRFSRTGVLAAGLVLAAGIGGLEACGGDDEPSEVDPADSGGSGGSTPDSGPPLVTPDSGPGAGGAGPDVPTIHVSGLPAPWPYYDEETAHGYRDADLGDGVRDQFGGADDASTQVELIYPLAGSLHPMNLGQITFQWTEDNDVNTVFALEISAGDQTYSFYVPCLYAQCYYEMPKSEWLDIGSRHAGQEVTITISATDGGGGPVATSAPTTISLSPQPVSGALYYWAGARSQIKRANFGAETAVPFIEPESPTNEFACVSCHSVSRDGSVIAFAVSQEEGENTAAIQIAPTSDPTNPYVRPTLGTTPFIDRTDLTHGVTVGPEDHLGHNVALSPDGSVAAVNGIPGEDPFWPPYFELRDARTGAALQRVSLGDAGFEQALPIFPEYSPDGQTIAVAMTQEAPGDECGVWGTQTCDSWLATLQVSGDSIGSPVTLVEADADWMHYYPTWSPDGQYVAFASAPKASGVSKLNANAVLRMVAVAGAPHACPGASCIELTNGTGYTVEQALAGGGVQSTWPKFTPFAQGDGGQILFISFTSKLDYGFLAAGNTQIWMFALDLGRLDSGDPSYPPFWLPYQDLGDASLTPFWTETLPCEEDPGGGCSGCVAGESCFVDSQNNCQCGAILPE